MAGAIDVEKHNFNRTDRVVIDTNVLFLVHANAYGDPKGRRIRTFSAALNKIHAVKAEAILLDLVLSEFINGVERVAAMDWAHRQKRSGLPRSEILKEFRQIDLYRRAVEDIKIAVDQIVRNYQFDHVIPLDPSNSSTFIGQMANAKADLNDLRIAKYCQSTGADLLTDDRDMIAFETSINVITSPDRFNTSDLDDD